MRGFQLLSWTCSVRIRVYRGRHVATRLASEYTAQNTRLTMIADLTTARVTLAGDNESGAGSAAPRQRWRTRAKLSPARWRWHRFRRPQRCRKVYQQALCRVASYRTQVAQDKNALNLLAGETVPDSLLPGTGKPRRPQLLSPRYPAGVSRRCCSAARIFGRQEHNLKSANGDTEAARANFFPTISDRQRWRQRCALPLFSHGNGGCGRSPHRSVCRCCLPAAAIWPSYAMRKRREKRTDRHL